MESVAALLDGFVSIIYANYYILMEIGRAIIHIQYWLQFVECFSVLLFIYFIQINLQSST